MTSKGFLLANEKQDTSLDTATKKGRASALSLEKITPQLAKRFLPIIMHPPPEKDVVWGNGSNNSKKEQRKD